MNDEKNKKIEDRIFQHVFNGNSLSFYITSKIHRILNAVFLITDKIKTSEPLRNFIRHKVSSSELMGIIIKDKATAKLAVESLVVLKRALETAHSVGLISTMNFDIVSNECDDVISIIFDADFDGLTDNFNISPKYFFVEKKTNPRGESLQLKTIDTNKNVIDQDKYSKGHNKGQNVLDNNKVGNREIRNQDNDKKVHSSSDSRESRILSILENRGEVTIKDISILITEFSEKTIQRELNNLVQKGVIKRTGERRWSRYSLV